LSRSEELEIVRGAGDSVGAAEYSLEMAEQ
jgi:hypothetical protein